MFYHDKRLQFPVQVDTPNPVFAKMLQQGLGGVEGELRVVLQYLLQACNNRGPSKYRDLLLETATEDLGHAEMYATAIAMNLDGSSAAVQEEMARQNPMVAAVMGGMSPRAFLSGGMGALAADSEGNPFDGSWVVSSGNIAADMFSNVTIEVSNGVVAARLSNLTDDPGMKRMLGYFIARDNMHTQQWLGVIEELGGYTGQLPIPNSFDHSQEMTQFSHTFFSTAVDGIDPPLDQRAEPGRQGRVPDRTAARHGRGAAACAADPASLRSTRGDGGRTAAGRERCGRQRRRHQLGGHPLALGGRRAPRRRGSDGRRRVWQALGLRVGGAARPGARHDDAAPPRWSAPQRGSPLPAVSQRAMTLASLALLTAATAPHSVGNGASGNAVPHLRGAAVPRRSRASDEVAEALGIANPGGESKWTAPQPSTLPLS